MKTAFSEPGIGAWIWMLALATVLSGPASARAGSVLVGEATTDSGHPVVTGSMIELVDSAGTVKQVLTTVPGVYKADTTGMTPPILIKSGDIYSYSLTISGVANVTPFSDLMVDQAYEAYGTNTSTEFLSSTPRKITPVQIRRIGHWSGMCSSSHTRSTKCPPPSIRSRLNLPSRALSANF